jgi:hypothetical protein
MQKFPKKHPIDIKFNEINYLLSKYIGKSRPIVKNSIELAKPLKYEEKAIKDECVKYEN